MGIGFPGSPKEGPYLVVRATRTIFQDDAAVLKGTRGVVLGLDEDGQHQPVLHVVWAAYVFAENKCLATGAGIYMDIAPDYVEIDRNEWVGATALPAGIEPERIAEVVEEGY